MLRKVNRHFGTSASINFERHGAGQTQISEQDHRVIHSLPPEGARDAARRA